MERSAEKLGRSQSVKTPHIPFNSDINRLTAVFFVDLVVRHNVLTVFGIDYYHSSPDNKNLESYPRNVAIVKRSHFETEFSNIYDE